MTPSESGAATSSEDVVREQKAERPTVQLDQSEATASTEETPAQEPAEDSGEESSTEETPVGEADEESAPNSHL